LQLSKTKEWHCATKLGAGLVEVRFLSKPFSSLTASELRRGSLKDPVHPLYNAYEPTIEYAGERDENIKMRDSATSTLEAVQSLPSRPELGVYRPRKRRNRLQ
jgi:hypothetical protein